MTPRELERALWAVAACVAFAGGVVWRTIPLASAAAPARALRAAPRWMDDPGGEGLARMGAALAEGDPFRLDRQPASVRYKPELEAPAGTPMPPTPPKPALALRGIIGGPPWDAMLDGVPGRQGSVLVHQGDTLGGLTIRAITRDTVTIHGADTTWRLFIKRSW